MSETCGPHSAARAMWELVGRYTGQVVYERGIKAEGLALTPPRIDCSGWVHLLLQAGLLAENAAWRRPIYPADYIADLTTWSDRMIAVVAERTGSIRAGDAMPAASLPPLATIGLNVGIGGWEGNRRRPRNINHVVQVVRRSSDGAGFVSEAVGLRGRSGLLLTPLLDWLDLAGRWMPNGPLYVVDAFAPATTFHPMPGSR